MSEARCTLQVRGLDCPKEVDSITAALKDRAGVARLGFDLIHGTMTVDYDDDQVEPAGLARLITERTGLQSTLEGEVERTDPSWWSRYGRWVVTLGSGLALAAGMAFSWLGPSFGLSAGPADRLARAGYALAVVIGGIGIFPRAARNLARLRFDIDVLMGLAILGAMAPGTMGRSRHGGVLVWPVGITGGAEPGLRATFDPRACSSWLRPRPNGSRSDGTTQKVAASRFGAATGSWFASVTRFRWTARWPGAIERRSEDDHGRVGPGPAGGGRSGVRRDDQRRRDAGSHGRRARWATRSISRVIAQVRASPGRPGADRAPNFAVRRRLHADRHRACRSWSCWFRRYGPWPRAARCGRRGCLARVVWARPGRARHRLSVCAGDRNAGGRRLRAGGGGTGRRA